MATKKASSTKKKAPMKKTSTTSSVAKTTVKTVPASAPKAGLSAHIESSLQSTKLWRALAAEFIGTFLLAGVFIAGQGQPIFVLFALIGIVLLVGGISGAHVNPAITIGAWVTRRIGWLRAVGYILAQILGAAAAFFVFNAFVGGAVAPSEQEQMYGKTAATLYSVADLATVAGKEWYIFFAELLGTTILGFAVAAGLSLRKRLSSAITIGSGMFTALLITFTVTSYVASAGAVLNPAVALTLQAYVPVVWSYAVYALAPIIGGVLGFIIHDFIRGRNVA